MLSRMGQCVVPGDAHGGDEYRRGRIVTAGRAVECICHYQAGHVIENFANCRRYGNCARPDGLGPIARHGHDDASGQSTGGALGTRLFRGRALYVLAEEYCVWNVLVLFLCCAYTVFNKYYITFTKHFLHNGEPV